MKKNFFSFILLTGLFPVSCSVSNKINRSAKENILKNNAFVSAHTGISVYEPATGKYFYNFQADKYFVPASNTKLATCYAAMKYLGDSLIGIRYNILNDSTVAIQSAADPTFLNVDFKDHPVYNFLNKFHFIQIEKTSFSAFLGNGWAWNDYTDDYMAQRSAFPIYGNIAKVIWRNDHSITFNPSYFLKHSFIAEPLTNGFEVIKSWDKNDFTFMNGSEKIKYIPFRPDDISIQNLLTDTLHQNIQFIETKNIYPNKVHSQPTDSLLKLMMHRSDNFFAEQSLLMVSNQLLNEMNDEKIVDTLLKTDFKLLPQSPKWVDGSGLSRYNLFSPEDFVFILNKMKNDFGMERMKNILPTGGTGTISNYYREDSGYIFVKTGTLNGVVALSGFLYTRKNKLLIFSVLVNNHRSSSITIRRGIEKFIQNIRNKN